MNAAMLGVVIHGEAGRLDEEKNGPIGMCASDLIPYIRLLINGRT
jgi:NAD(P)H-hydrate epimerase